MITIAARVGFDTVDEIADRFSGVDFPIELALPWQYPLWRAAEARWDEMLRLLQSARLTVQSVHATQGPIGDWAFPSWGKRTCELAELLGARVVTVHPERAKGDRIGRQAQAFDHVTRLQETTRLTLAVETFGGRDRLFQPGEIISLGLPMTLDVSHIHSDQDALTIAETYHEHIPLVHLSARGEKEHHLPVDAFCLGFVRQLARLGWSGGITLEYLPWHHYRLRKDMELVREALERNIRPAEIRPPCDAYRDRREMWGHDAPDPEG